MKTVYLYRITLTVNNSEYYYFGIRVFSGDIRKDNYKGSPKTNKHLWDKATSIKKDVLFSLPYTEENHLKLAKNENKLIKEAWEKYGAYDECNESKSGRCLNASIGRALIPTEALRKKISISRKEYYSKNPELKGNLGRSKEKHSEDSRKAALKVMEQKIGIFAMTKEQKRENGLIAGQIVKERKIGICGLTFEQRSKFRKEWIKNHPEEIERIRKIGKENYINKTGIFTEESRERCKQANLERTTKEFTVKSPEGVIYKGKGRKPFAREHGINETSFNNLVRGLIKEYKGWTLVKESLDEETKKNLQKTMEIYKKKEDKKREFTVKSPEGVIYKGRGLRTFAREHNLIPTCLRNLLKGKINHHKGWTRG